MAESGSQGRAGPDLPSEALDFVRKTLGRSATVVALAGDASTRRFYRISGGSERAVLMLQDDPLAEDSGQISNYRLLKKIGAPVPRILARDDQHGSILFEDFGDLSLQRSAGQADREQTRRLYLQASALIDLLQAGGATSLDSGDFAATNALDRERFLFELNHFERHFIRGLLKRTPSPDEEAVLRHLYDDLAEACDRLPRVYCHRDFQSRNLMVHEGNLVLIDFQDARMGPYTYDAASLLRDSSLDLPEDLVEEMLGRLEETCAARLGIGGEEFRHDFDLMALQRNIKDLGTFGYMATVRGRAEYLEYVPRTKVSIRRTLVASRRYHSLYGLFTRLVLD